MSNFKALFLSGTSQTKEPTPLAELEKTGVTRTGNGSDQKGLGLRSSIDMMRFAARSGSGVLLSALYSSFSPSPVPLVRAPTPPTTGTLNLASFSFSPPLLLLVVADRSQDSGI